MYDKDTEEFVNENLFSGSRSDVHLKICGNVVTFKEFHEGTYCYDYPRRKKKLSEKGTLEDVTLGRASVASEEQQVVNQKRVYYRRKLKLMDTANCNEMGCPTFHTFVDHNNGDLSLFHEHREAYYKRQTKFIQTGNLYGKKVESFTPIPDFKLKAFGVVAFQDGKRNKHKTATGDCHGHQLQNTPYLPQVPVITAKVRDPNTFDQKQCYLNQQGDVYYWSKVADRHTLWFQTQAEAAKCLHSLRGKLPGFYFNPQVKKLCVAALLWERGFIDIRKVKDLHKKGKCSNVGEYMVSQYMADNVDPRLNGRKAHFKTGKLEKPEIIRDPLEVERMLLMLFAKVKHVIGEDGTIKAVCEEVTHWKEYIMKEVHLIAEYIGAMSIYTLNLLYDDYPWMKRYYELRREGERMTKADWIATGVIEELQPCLF